jgi:hypothetical protein
MDKNTLPITKSRTLFGNIPPGPDIYTVMNDRNTSLSVPLAALPALLPEARQSSVENATLIAILIDSSVNRRVTEPN